MAFSTCMALRSIISKGEEKHTQTCHRRSEREHVARWTKLK